MLGERPRPRTPRAAASPPPLLLHHRAATRLAVGTLPGLVCAAALVACDLFALAWPSDAAGGAAARAELLPHVALLVALLALEAPVVSALRTGGATATVRVALTAAAVHVLPSAVAARDAVGRGRAAAHFCAESRAPTACADLVLSALLAPLGAPFFLVAGLPPRFALPLELARLGGCAAVVFASLAAAPGGLDTAWAARYAAKCVAAAAAGAVLLRAALGADEPRELALLHLCPRALRAPRDALMAAGAALAAVPALETLPLTALSALFAYFAAIFARLLLNERGGGGSAVARHAVLCAWAVAFGTATVQAARMQARRAARHARQQADRRVHALHLRLSTLDDSVDAEATLATAAMELLAAFPPGCSVALAEWTTNDSSSAASSPASTSPRSSAKPPSPRRGALSRVLARSPRPHVENALRAAVRRGCARQGSAAAALAKPGAAAGLTLDSEDFAEGAEAFADWAALVSDAAAGPGIVSLSLVGSGAAVVGALWVHAPAGVHAPAPAAVREYADCIGAVLLRNRAHRAALRAAAADARADADATLALQRSFLSGITHELRTPLNAVVGFTSTVLEGAQLTPTDAEYLRCSMTAANTLLGIIDQLLDYSKWARQAEGQADAGGSGQAPLSALAAAPLRLCTVLDELVDVLGGRAAAAGVALRVEACPASQAARLRGDAPRLRQVLINITDNALKYTRRDGAVTVAVSMCSAPRRAPRPADDSEADGSSSSEDDTASIFSDDGTAGDVMLVPDAGDDGTLAAADAGTPSTPSLMRYWVRISVKDTGIGVPPDQQWRLFRPFSQVLQNTAPGVKPVGSGLGLVISRAIVREMGGDITFTSLPGVGTTFTIVAPFQADEEAAAAPAAGDALSPTSLAGVTLLPLLRDAATGAMCARMAASWGAKAASAPAGASSLDDVVAAVDAVASARADPDAPLILLVDPPALLALRRADLPPLPRGACCVLAAPPAEHAAWTGAAAAARGVTPPDLLLSLPTSPGRLASRLRAATAFLSEPLGGATAEAEPSPATAAPPFAPAPGAAALRVLLSEDNAMNAAVARAVLARCGVKTPRIVGDGEAAVAAFRESLAPDAPPWSIILLDMQMPRMDGPDAARAIRALEAAQPAPLRRPGARLVAVTANSAEEDRQACMGAGMDEFLVKPITPAAMRACLARVAAP